MKQSGYRQLPSQLVLDGQIQNFGCGRPMDGTNFEHSITTETGTSFLIDSYQAALSIDEGCGLFLNWFDNYCRLAGFQLDIQSYAEHVVQRYDEGENFAFRGSLIYPWESVGAYQPETSGGTAKYDYKDYQLDPEMPYGNIDLPEDKTDIVPIYRYMEYGGYVGQGSTRMLTLPSQPQNEPYNSLKNPSTDTGLWQETVSLDGSYTMRSAKSVTMSKYVLIPIPKRVALADDTSKGSDSYREGNYRFSGKWYGSGPGKHPRPLIWDYGPGTGVEKDDKPLVKASAVLDLLAFNYNWRNTHTFYYHKNDYVYPSEATTMFQTQAEGGGFKSAFYEPEYDDLASQSYLDAPESAKLDIDHRFKEVEYFESSSQITLLDDGGVVISDGFGAQITMTGGQIRLEAPGDVMLMPGTRAVTLCDEFIVRAKSNIELSSSEKDVRLKAEGNMQLLSGNGGNGGMLIENKSTQTWKHQYENLYGDDVVDSGITLLAPYSGVAAVSNSIYMRSDAVEGYGGQLTLDGGQGNNNIVMYGKAIHVFESEGMTLWEGPQGTDPGEMKETHRFHGSGTLHSSPFYCIGNLITTGDLVVGKGVAARKNIMAGEKLAHYGSVFVGDLEGSDTDLRGNVEQAVKSANDASTNIISMGQTTFKGAFEELYSDSHLGNSNFITNTIGFSFNDKKDRPNSYGYSPEKFKLLEAKWQRKIDGTKASWGKAWTETSVMYQGAQSYPWPGEKHWTEGENFLTGPELNFVEKSDGGYCTSDQRTFAESGSLGKDVIQDFTREVPQGTYILIGGD
jgi:hypothetical protein